MHHPIEFPRRTPIIRRLLAFVAGRRGRAREAEFEPKSNDYGPVFGEPLSNELNLLFGSLVIDELGLESFPTQPISRGTPWNKLLANHRFCELNCFLTRSSFDVFNVAFNPSVPCGIGFIWIGHGVCSKYALIFTRSYWDLNLWGSNCLGVHSQILPVSNSGAGRKRTLLSRPSNSSLLYSRVY